MGSLRLVLLAAVVSGITHKLAAQEPEKPLPPADRAPHLVLAHTGPFAPVRALAFAPDASVLYVAGFDKQVRRYKLVEKKYVSDGSIRIPIGPGNAGVVNALAISPDGKWLAVAGRAPMRGESWAHAGDGVGEDFRNLPALLRRDAGVVYLFDTTKPNDGGRVVRGAESEVRALAFANPAPASGNVLVTAGSEWNEKGARFGVVRAYDPAGEPLGSLTDLPGTEVRPGLAAWASADKKQLRVAVAWEKARAEDGGELVVWNVGGKADRQPDAVYNAPLAVRVKKETAVEVVSAGVALNDKRQYAGRVAVRGTDSVGKPDATVWLTGADKELVVPLAIAALTVPDTGDATAVLTEIEPRPAGTVGRAAQLRLLAPTGARTVPLAGIAADRLPVLAAAPDGRFVAVAGFSDNRVEVYETTSLAAGKPEVQKLTGDSDGFSKVAFLKDGGTLWLGKGTDTPEKGGVVLDLDAKVRTAAPRGAKDELKVDSPKDAKSLAPAEKQPDRVTVVVDGTAKTIELPGERITAAVFLPGKPDWEPALGPVVAVAHIHEHSQTVLVTLFDVSAEKPKPLIRFGGPMLAVRSLAFSGTRALLAAAGDDGTVAVWSMKNAARKLPGIEGLIITTRTKPAIEGLLVTERSEVVVTAVRPGSAPALAKLKAGDVIESVADTKGTQKPVETTLDFMSAIRALEIGKNAQIKVRNQAPVAVVVGTATGFRHPLFELWVDPAEGANRDWIGWTSSGPYDTNGAAAEARIGWLSATGIPARPVTFAPAEQYRKLYYKRDFIRLLIEKADYNDALAAMPEVPRPTIDAALAHETETFEGQLIVREPPTALSIALTDTASVLDRERVEVRLQIVGPGGTSAWTSTPLKADRATLNLPQYAWKRGEYLVRVRLFQTGAEPGETSLKDERVLRFTYALPRPVLSAKIAGEAPKYGVEIATDKEEVEVAPTVDAKANPDGATVTVSWTGSEPVALARNADGTFPPYKIKLKVNEPVTVVVTATNRSDGVNPRIESSTVEARVRRLAPKAAPPPSIALLVSPFDFHSPTERRYTVGTPKVSVVATVTDAQPVTEFEWLIDGVSTKGNPEMKSQARPVEVPAARPLTVRVRAKTKDGREAFESVEIRYERLPEVWVTKLRDAVVTAPELYLSGGLTPGAPRYKVRLTVRGAEGRTREFDPNLTETGWEARVTLFPGENQLGYAVGSDERPDMRRVPLVDVKYARPPVVAQIEPLDVGTGTAGVLNIVVMTTPDAPPSELWVEEGRVGFKPRGAPGRMFGLAFWALRAEGVPVRPGPERLEPVRVMVRNAERDSARVPVKVLGQNIIKDIPVLNLTHNGRGIAPDDALPPVGDSAFRFGLKATSDSRFEKLEVWHTVGGQSELVRTAKLADSVTRPDGTLLVSVPELKLRPGYDNHVRVVVANASGGSATTSFRVSYTPPAVRVRLTMVTEPNGKQTPVPPDFAGQLKVDAPKVDVSGHIEWDFDNDPLATDDTLAAVFVANGVAHLPVRVNKLAKPGDRVRTFKGTVYLNALIPNPSLPAVTNLRVELRSGGRPMAVPQSAQSRPRLAVATTDPFRKQRLHVLVLGVEIPEAERRQLIANVIAAVGGTPPEGVANFTAGLFNRKGFDSARLYAPRLGYTNSGDLNALLNAARADIEARAERRGEEWVNDVIVVYYQGADWTDARGRRFLHSGRTLSGSAGPNLADDAIRLDTVPQVPGMPVAVLNVAGGKMQGDDFAQALPVVRCAWADASATAHFLPVVAEYGGNGWVTLEALADLVKEKLPKPARAVLIDVSASKPADRRYVLDGTKP